MRECINTISQHCQSSPFLSSIGRLVLQRDDAEVGAADRNERVACRTPAHAHGFEVVWTSCSGRRSLAPDPGQRLKTSEDVPPGTSIHETPVIGVHKYTRFSPAQSARRVATGSHRTFRTGCMSETTEWSVMVSVAQIQTLCGIKSLFVATNAESQLHATRLTPILGFSRLQAPVSPSVHQSVSQTRTGRHDATEPLAHVQWIWRCREDRERRRAHDEANLTHAAAASGARSS